MQHGDHGPFQCLDAAPLRHRFARIYMYSGPAVLMQLAKARVLQMSSFNISIEQLCRYELRLSPDGGEIALVPRSIPLFDDERMNLSVENLTEALLESKLHLWTTDDMEGHRVWHIEFGTTVREESRFAQDESGVPSSSSSSNSSELLDANAQYCLDAWMDCEWPEDLALYEGLSLQPGNNKSSNGHKNCTREDTNDSTCPKSSFSQAEQECHPYHSESQLSPTPYGSLSSTSPVRTPSTSPLNMSQGTIICGQQRVILRQDQPLISAFHDYVHPTVSHHGSGGHIQSTVTDHRITSQLLPVLPQASGLHIPPVTGGYIHGDAQRSASAPASAPALNAESMPMHQERRYPCRYCDRRFLREYTRKVHETTHLPRETGPFLCSEHDCGSQFSRQHDRLRHEVSKHGKKCPWTCGVCRKFFSSQKSLERHNCIAARRNVRCH